MHNVAGGILAHVLHSLFYSTFGLVGLTPTLLFEGLAGFVGLVVLISLRGLFKSGTSWSLHSDDSGDR